MSEYRTISGYDRKKETALTRAMEDYLEMICRYCIEYGYIRVTQLSELLNVTPSSASKMADQLKQQGYIEYEKYGYILPTQAGWEVGDYLLHRHDVVHRLLRLINGTEDELEQVEQIEHFFDRRTIENLEKWLDNQP